MGYSVEAKTLQPDTLGTQNETFVGLPAISLNSEAAKFNDGQKVHHSDFPDRSKADLPDVPNTSDLKTKEEFYFPKIDHLIASKPSDKEFWGPDFLDFVQNPPETPILPTPMTAILVAAFNHVNSASHTAQRSFKNNVDNAIHLLPKSSKRLAVTGLALALLWSATVFCGDELPPPISNQTIYRTGAQNACEDAMENLNNNGNLNDVNGDGNTSDDKQKAAAVCQKILMDYIDKLNGWPGPDVVTDNNGASISHGFMAADKVSAQLAAEGYISPNDRPFIRDSVIMPAMKKTRENYVDPNI